MLLIEARLQVSPLDGIGLFATEDLLAGTPVWEHDEVLNATIDASRLPRLGRAFVWKYAWIDPDSGEYVLDLDDSRFINHAEDSALLPAMSGPLVLARDVRAGEEITWQYDTLDRSWYRGPVPLHYRECGCGAIFRFALKHSFCPKCERIAEEPA